MNAPATTIKHTYSDYLKTPEGKYYELINGVMDMSPAPYTRHQRILLTLSVILEKFVNKNHCGEVLLSPVDIYLDNANVVQPDIVFVASGRKAIIKEKYIKGAPDLAVEIVSPGSEKRDTIEKKALYEKFGVKEYWIIDPDKKNVEVFCLIKGQFRLIAIFNEMDIMTPHSILDGLKIPMKKVFYGT